MMKIVMLQPDEKGNYIKKGECDNLNIINIDFNDGTEPLSFNLTSYCNWQGIPIKWDKKE